MFETKIAIVVREDLPVWQKLNVTAFLMSGITGAAPELIGEPYLDHDRNSYHGLSVQPVIILSADQATLSAIHGRVLEQQIPHALYIEEMFQTGHDEANRAVFAKFGPGSAKVVGLGVRAARKEVDRITKGARMHP